MGERLTGMGGRGWGRDCQGWVGVSGGGEG